LCSFSVVVDGRGARMRRGRSTARDSGRRVSSEEPRSRASRAGRGGRVAPRPARPWRPAVGTPTRTLGVRPLYRRRGPPGSRALRTRPDRRGQRARPRDTRAAISRRWASRLARRRRPPSRTSQRKRTIVTRATAERPTGPGSASAALTRRARAPGDLPRVQGSSTSRGASPRPSRAIKASVALCTQGLGPVSGADGSSPTRRASQLVSPE
jgi:hypothetical protein